jgi:hypothetical protein
LVTVPAVHHIILSPSQISEIDINENKTITAIPYSEKGKPLKRQIAWSKSSNKINIDPLYGDSTTVTGVRIGQTSVTASSETVINTAPVTVPSVSSISIEPPSVNVTVDQSKTLKAISRSSLGTPINRLITWETPGNNIKISPIPGNQAEVKVWGLNPGDDIVTASSEGVSARAHVHVQTLCETNQCIGAYIVHNTHNTRVAVYQTFGSWYNPQFVGVVPSNERGISDSLVDFENMILFVRTFEEGAANSDYSNWLNDVWLVCGPGGIFEIMVF